ncbi:hypothetical protein ACFO1B_40245 [Dactylosporangium siamense]|uniref:HEAT repeat domain-containing protein n=1 Tax=Dactylosporangium siamense TaxID=685454 RepID=A0A919PSE3_9ACTN|nr:hypothetical protein [Dactylosporangium siamense]GIG50025.1 hypothetical protein Dsi01nite_080660 [Dactylosporangium siamense]
MASRPRLRPWSGDPLWQTCLAAVVVLLAIGVLLLWVVGLVRGYVSMVAEAPLLAAVCTAIGVVVVVGAGRAYRWLASTHQSIPNRRPDVHLARHELPGYRALLTTLDRQAGRAAADAFADLVDHSAAINGLIFHARRRDLRAELQPFADRVLAAAPRPDPVASALASLHEDGHVREAAVAGMAARPLPEHVPFLVERAVDWVEPVRVRALRVLRDLLAAHPDRYRPLIAGALPRVAARRHAAGLAGLVD